MAELVKTKDIGRRVRRNPDIYWEWGDQDHKNGQPCEGVIVKQTDIEGWVSVEWNNGTKIQSYRIGSKGRYDLVYADVESITNTEYKLGDWVTVTNTKALSNNRVGNTYKILEVKIDALLCNKKQAGYKLGVGGSWECNESIRRATKEEILKVEPFYVGTTETKQDLLTNNTNQFENGKTVIVPAVVAEVRHGQAPGGHCLRCRTERTAIVSGHLRYKEVLVG
jgi:hypothetical protein